jgi:hypothetical protein
VGQIGSSPVEVAIETLCYRLHEKQEVRRRLHRRHGEFFCPDDLKDPLQDQRLTETT